MVDYVTIREETWPLADNFSTSREVKTSANTIVVEIKKDGIIGRGECFPLKRFGNTQASVIAEIEAIQDQILTIDNNDLQNLLPASAARNAVDCALWDWQAHAAGQSLGEMVGIPDVKPVQTSYTLSLDTPERMAMNAAAHSEFKILKMKMNGFSDDVDRIKAVKSVAQDAQLILDANEAWSLGYLETMIPFLLEANVVLIEQPLPEGKDDGLLSFTCPIPIAADESCHTVESLAGLKGKYQVINIKLDKTGGLTHALKLKKQAQKIGFGVMVGCMVSTSLSILPALMVAQGVQFCDLDGALLLEKDPYDRVFYQNGQIFTG